MSAVEIPTPLPPNAIEAEEALLGCILIDSDALLATRMLKPDDFYRLAHQVIYRTMRHLDDDGLPIDPITLVTRLERTGLIEEAGGSIYVQSLVNAVPTSQNAHHYADLVKQASEGRRVLHVAQNLVHIGYRSDDPARAAMRAVESLAADASDENGLNLTPEEARARLAVIAPTMQRLDELLAEEFEETLWVVPDLLPEGLTLLAAKPKLGKSWLALGLALAVASGGEALGKVQVEQGDVLYLALEDSPKRIHQRSKQLLRGQPAPAALEFDTRCPRLDEGGLRLLEVWLLAHPDARLIILDTLTKIRGQARSATLYGDDYASLEGVQKLAHARGVAILVIHHTGKESREDPLDEVNATQGLNGVADNVLVLRRERGKPTATLIGDGRKLNGIERTLAFDLSAGGWRLTEAPPTDQPKTPERAEILDLLKASESPMSPKQVADALGKNINTIYNLLTRMVRDGDIKLARHGKYIPVEDVKVVEDSSIKREKKNTTPLFDMQEGSSTSPSSTTFTSSTGVAEPEAETMPDPGDDTPSAEPPADFRRFVETVARLTHSRVDSYTAMATPDAHDPYTLL